MKEIYFLIIKSHKNTHIPKTFKVTGVYNHYLIYKIITSLDQTWLHSLVRGYIFTRYLCLPLPKWVHCFWDGSHWHWRQRKTSYLLCNWNTLWNILMILDRNVDQDKMMCHIQDWHFWLSFGVITLLFEKDLFSVRSGTRIPFGIFWWYLVEM